MWVRRKQCRCRIVFLLHALKALKADNQQWEMTITQQRKIIIKTTTYFSCNHTKFKQTSVKLIFSPENILSRALSIPLALAYQKKKKTSLSSLNLNKRFNR